MIPRSRMQAYRMQAYRQSPARMLSGFLAAVLVAGVATIIASVPHRGAGADVLTNSGDSARTGWYPNQPKLTPAAVGASDFGQLGELPVTGQVYAQPVISGGTVLVATEANNIYGFDSTTYQAKWNRNLGTPVPIINNCTDITPTIGITSTPVVDANGIAYVMSNRYAPDGTTVAFYLDAVSMATGAEQAGFPVQIQGAANNDPSKVFSGKYELQRPGLLLMNGVVYAGFAGHCDSKPYEGWIVGVSTTAPKLTAMWSSEAGPGAVTDATHGPGGGVWMSGSGLMSDQSGDIVFSTGNGQFPATGPADPAVGKLAQSVVRLRVQPDGTLKTQDYFSPYDNSSLDTGDSDVGSGGVVALPPKYFGTPAHPNLIVTAGKQQILWTLDAAHLGGVGQGPNGGDDDVASVTLGSGLRGKPSVWGGDGGYIYVPTSSSSTGSGRLEAYKYTKDGSGNPVFSLTGRSSDTFGFGGGSAVVTSNADTSGSALVWVVWFPPTTTKGQIGKGAQLRAYQPVPVNGTMVQVKSLAIGDGTKFAIPAVDNGHLFMPTSDNKVLVFGAPAATVISGSTVNFPNTVVGSSSTATATLTASTAQTVSAIASNNPAYTVTSTSPALPAALAAGANITVGLTFAPTGPGVAAAQLNVTTSASANPIAALSMSGTGEASGPLLSQYPCCISFGGVTAGGIPVTKTVSFSNAGAQPLIISGYGLPAAPFTVTGLPAAGSSIAPGATVSASVTFAPTKVGVYSDELFLHTNDPTATGEDGAAGAVTLSGSGGGPAVMRLTPSSLDYGDVPVGTTASQFFSITNTGGTDLNITISKVPAAPFSAQSSFSEGSVVPAGQTVLEQVDFTPTATGPATSEWALTGDDGQGRLFVTLTGNGIAAGAPTLSAGDVDVNRVTSGTQVVNVAMTLSAPSATAVTANFTTKDGTATVAAGDYAATSGTVTFPAGTTTQTVPVTVNGAAPSAISKTLTVNLSAVTGAALGDASGKIYLNSVYLPRSIYVDDSSVASTGATTNLNFPVTVSPPPAAGQTVTVNAATVDGSATVAAGDYAAVNTTLTFTNSSPTQTVTVPIVHPPAAGASKTVSLSLGTASTGSNIADATALGTVYTSTAPPAVLYASDSQVARPATGSVTAAFTVRLSRASSSPVSVNYTPVASTGLAAGDVLTAPGTLTFAPGTTTQSVPVQVSGSATATGTAVVILNLSAAVGAGIADSGGKGYLVSPVVHPFVSVLPASGWVNPSRPTTVNVAVTIPSPYPSDVTINAATGDGTGPDAAVAGADYTAASGPVVIPAGQTSASFAVTVLPHPAVVAAKTFSVTLSGGIGATTISSAVAAVTLYSHSAAATPAPVPAPPTLTSSTAPTSGVVGTPLSFTFTASGSPQPSFEITSGGLPTGLALNAATGQVSGTPSAVGTYTFTVGATNTVGAEAESGSKTITITAASSAPVFTAASPSPSATTGTPYSYAFAADGTPAPTFALNSGSLPPGLTLNATSGVLSGTPTTAGSFSFTVRAANGVGVPAVTATLTITVGPASGAGSADLFAKLTGPSSGVSLGANVSYTLTVRNLGPSKATGIVAHFTLPAGTTLVSSSPSVALVNGTLTFTKASLSSGSAVHFKIKVKPAARGSYTGTGSATASQSDPNTANNTASFVATVK